MVQPVTATPDVSIVVVSYNSRGVLEACLESLRAARQGLNVELFVVDNASLDGSGQMVAKQFPEATLISSPQNLGFGRANNLAFERASGRYLLVLNPDTVLHPQALRVLILFADEHPEAGAVGARLEYTDGRLQHSAFRIPDLQQAFFGFFDVIPIDSSANGRYSTSEYSHPFETEHLLGACLLLRREALDDLGGFDPHYFMYFEETDLCARLRRAGWKNLFTPSARVVHVGGASTSADPEHMSVEFHRSQARFYREHRGVAGYAGLKVIVWLGTAYRLGRSIRACLRGKISHDLLRTRLAGYWKILWF